MKWSTTQSAGAFWGKLDRPDKAGPPLAWHPLEDHCIDVAAVVEALLALPPIRRPLARLAGQDELHPVQIARLCVLAGLHDLGKFNHGFQAKAGTGKRTAGHVTEVLDLLLTENKHQSAAWSAVQVELLQGWGEGCGALLIASICHHGKPLGPAGERDAALWHPEDRDPIAGMSALTRRLLATFPASLDAGPELPTAPGFTHGWAGLMMLADWIGSDRRAFPFTEAGDGERMSFARRAAATALLEIGLDSSPMFAALRGAPLESAWVMAKVGPDGRETLRPPRPAQQMIRTLPIPRAASVSVLEAETGSGKTEAALLRFLDLFRASVVDGLYFALPTRAAAVQIHRRIFEITRRVFGDAAPAVILAVPGYLRVDDQEAQRGLCRFDTLWDDARQRQSPLRAWAVENAKRYLAGAVVVGTVDQVMLGALQVPHANLRAAALLRHLLVVDEVHASDPYMTHILEAVLEHHAMGGGHALLMSATLGSGARARYLRSAAPPALDDAIAMPYPLISHAEEGRVLELRPPGTANAKRIRWELCPLAADSRAVAARALAHARNGARVLVIRSTVRDCVATQRALEQLVTDQDRELLFMPREGIPAPHHSRYAPADRKWMDAALEERFRQRRPVVVVATQTVEQSLDLDADRMITDLCPMDVLLQRVGRLHRHADAARPPGFSDAVCEVLVPGERDLSSTIRGDGQAFGPHGLGTVYQDLLVLEATWRLLEASATAVIPDDNRRLVERATHPTVRRALRAQGPAWQKHGGWLEGTRQAQALVAELQCMNWSVPFDETRLPTDQGRVLTRLGDPDRTLRLTPVVPSPFGLALSSVNVPHRWATGLDPEATEAEAEVRGEQVLIRCGALSWVYSRFGLEKAP